MAVFRRCCSSSTFVLLLTVSYHQQSALKKCIWTDDSVSIHKNLEIIGFSKLGGTNGPTQVQTNQHHGNPAAATIMTTATAIATAETTADAASSKILPAYHMFPGCPTRKLEVIYPVLQNL